MYIDRPRLKFNLVLMLFLVIFLASFARGYAGNYCTTSPCSCGTNCNGGYELSGHSAAYCNSNPIECYNTINTCKDGPEDFFEYVDDITVTSFNDTVFRGADTVEVDAYVDCDSGGDEITFSYYNGSAWKTFFDVTCSYDGKRHYYQNLTLDDVTANHTIRVALAYDGSTGMLCGYSYDNIYTDTDDVSFYVLDSNDHFPPSVNATLPFEGASYLSIPNLVINISANVSDDVNVGNVSANISWGSKSEIISLINIINSLYKGNFTNTTEFTRYDVTILAYDNSSNLNNTETTYFYVNATANITFTTPEENGLYVSLPGTVEYEIKNGSDIYKTWLDVQGLNNYTASNLKISYENNGLEPESIYQHNNLSQSFFVQDTMYVDKISLKLKKIGNGTNISRIEIRNSTNGHVSSYIYAYSDINATLISSIDFTWVNFTLNQTIYLSADDSYWLFLTPNSSIENYYQLSAGIDQFSGGNFSQNISKDLLFKVYDKYRYNLSFTPTQSSHNLKAYANTSYGVLTSNQIRAFYDFTAPVISDSTYNPTDIFDLDPNVLVNFTVNSTDNLNIRDVYLEYRLQNDTVWTNRTMVNISGLFMTNLSIANNNNLTFRIKSVDTSDQVTSTSNTILEIAYDWNWTLQPLSFNSSGAIINNNVTVGNLSITSYSDYNLTFNLTSISDRLVYFNDSESAVITLSPEDTVKFEVKATGAATTQEDFVNMRIRGQNNSINPLTQYSNFTLISYVSGPYLYVDIVEYDASVYPGDHIGSIKAKISNVGNETAYNVTALWTLPSGWSSRDELNRSYSNLTSGGIEILEFRITADLATDASTGQKTISIFANSSNGYSGLDSRTVTVVEENETEQPDTPSSSSSTRTISSPIASTKPDIYCSLSRFEVPRSEQYSTEFVLANNLSFKPYYNLSLEIDGIFRKFYNLTPDKIGELTYNKTKVVKLWFNLPGYFEEGLKNLTLVIKTSTGEILKPFSIIVYDSEISLIECLNTSLNRLKLMEEKGIDIGLMYEIHNQSQLKFTEGDYTFVRTYCNELQDYFLTYEKQKIELEKISGKISELKLKGYNTEELEDFQSLLTETFYQGNFVKSQEFIDRLNLLIETTENFNKPLKLRLIDFYNLNKSLIFTFIIIFPIVVFLASKLIYISKTENRIKLLEKSKRKTLDLLINLQEDFFNKHVINQDMYKTYLDNYQHELGKINVSLIKLKSKRYLRKAKDSDNHQKEEILNLIKQLQEDYYIKKTIDQDSYEKLELYYDTVLSKLDIKLPKKIEVIKKTEEIQETYKPVAEKIEKPKSEPVLKHVEELKKESKVEEIKKPTVKKVETVKEKIKEKLNPLFEKRTDFVFYLKNGKKISNIKELYELLDYLDRDTFYYHVNKQRNDFENWIRDVYHDFKLAKLISTEVTKDAMKKAIEDYFKVGGKH